MRQQRLDQTLALAGIMHATWLVRQVARQERVDQEQLAIALRPVFELEPDSVAAVYGDAAARHSMLTVLRSQLGGGDAGRDMEATRYAATLMHLERKLVKRNDLMQQLRDGIEQARTQFDHFGITHENLIGRLADLYSETISTLRPQIMVQGDASTLTNPTNANRIRALLLAGMRSAVLWRQSGGSRLRLILGRQRLIQAAEELDRA
ncbi:MAG: high frequency lysogenization protein HflD [Halofilum sp. (in: g-proteobacteria)]